MDELTFTRQTHDGVLRLVASGQIHLHTAYHLQVELDQVLGQHAGMSVEIDLADVSFMDSSGVGALLGCLAGAQRAGSSFAVLNPRPVMYRTLRMMGLLEVLRVRTADDPGSSGG